MYSTIEARPNVALIVETSVVYGRQILHGVARYLRNYMIRIMGPAPKQNIVPGHALPEEAFVELYTLFREQPALKEKLPFPVEEQQYLALAEFWIDNRGNHIGRHPTGAYNQDDKPIAKQEKIVGHAVRAGLLASGVAAAAAINGRRDYAETASRWWANMAEARMYITGGLGAIPTHEGFGEDFELPNTGYAETCAAVAGGFFSYNLNLVTGEARYLDVLERELYNGALSGVSLSGDAYFYTNHLSGGPDNRRRDWCGIGTPHAGTPCCPPMFLKLFGALPGYLYATDEGGVYVNLYASSTAQIEMQTLKLTLEQTTNYPWDGVVVLTLTPGTPSAFALNLRLPGWARDATVALNGSVVENPPAVNGYLRLERIWNAGDTVTLQLPMPVERIKSDQRVSANLGRVALMRGPIVYCLESLDNAAGTRALVMPSSAEVTSVYLPDMLGGITVLRGEGQRVQGGTESPESVPFTAIPFYANSNREPTEMDVWIADDDAYAKLSEAPCTEMIQSQER